MSDIIRITIPDLDRTIADLTGTIRHLPDDCKKAVARAVNRTLEAVRAEAVRVGREAYTAKAESLRKGSRIRKATAANPYGVLELRGRRGIPLVQFLPQPDTPPNWKGVHPRRRAPKEGVSSQVKRGGARYVHTKDGHKPFFAAPRGELGLWVRIGPGRSDLRQRFGPSPIQAFSRPGAKERLEAKARETFPKRLRHEVDALLSGAVPQHG